MNVFKYLKEKNNQSCFVLGSVFFILILLFSIIAGLIAVPAFRKYINFIFLNAAGIIFSLLGVVLVLLTLRKKIKGLLKNFLILTGVCAAGFSVSVILHNLIYGLFIILFGRDFWDIIGLSDEPLFFLLAILVFPAGFLIGVVGTLITFIKEKKQH